MKDSERCMEKGSLRELAVLFDALASEPRLKIFQAIASGGRDGLAAGIVAEACGMPANTASFHLKELAGAGLLKSSRRGRSIIYRIAVNKTRHLMRFLAVDLKLGNSFIDWQSEDGRSVFRQIQTFSPDKTTVIFICRGNSVRSQIAEGLLKHFAGGQYNVASGGDSPKPVHPMAKQVMAEIGIDISGQETKSFRGFMAWAHIDHVIFVCGERESDCPSLYPFAAEQEHWAIDSPSSCLDDSNRLAGFRRCRDQIRDRVADWVHHRQTTPERIA